MTAIREPIFGGALRARLPCCSVGRNAPGQRVRGVRRLIIEDNHIELRQFPVSELLSAPTGIGITDNYSIVPPNGPPPYVFGEVIIRRNTVRLLDGILDPNFAAAAILVTSAKKLLVEDNIVDPPVLDLDKPMVHWRCGQVKYLNNRTSAGALIQGIDGDTRVKRSELEVEIEDAMLLAL